jgi:hypothetical protein
MNVTYCEVRYLTPSGRPSRAVYRWGDRWTAKVRFLESRGCTVQEVRVQGPKGWKTVYYKEVQG